MQKSTPGFNDHTPNRITNKIKFGIRQRMLANSKVSYMKNKDISTIKK